LDYVKKKYIFKFWSFCDKDYLYASSDCQI